VTATLQRVQDASTSAILQSLRIRAERDPLRYLRPCSDEQEAFLRSPTRGNFACGGNRSGKSQGGAIRTCARATGATLLGTKHKRARRIWCISQELPGGEDKPHTQVEAIRRWMPVAALRGQTWNLAYSPGRRVLSLANGCKLEFKSYDQDLLAFESAAIDHIWYDEEPTRKEIFTSCRARLIDRKGTWDMTLTPVLSLQGNGAIAEELWDKRQEAEQSGEYACFVLPTAANRFLDAAEVTAAASAWSEEERQVRLYGAFARLGGRVLSEFIPEMAPKGHLVRDFIPPHHWRHYLIIDPGWITAGHLFAAVDPQGCIYLYAELYAEKMPIAQRMAVLHGAKQAFEAEAGGPIDYDVIGDSAEFYVNRVGGTERELPSDFAEYQHAADALGATWFRPRPCIKADPYAYRVKRYLQCRQLYVCKGLRWWQWECERWTYQKARNGPTAMEKPIPDAPIKRNDHLLDPTRYLCNELPDPVPAAESTIYDPYAEHWAKVRERMDGTDRSEVI
jgi:phage terminase large subunit-like protein